MTRVAAIDCGTNSIRLLVADVPPTGGATDLVRRLHDRLDDGRVRGDERAGDARGLAERAHHRGVGAGEERPEGSGERFGHEAS